MAFPSPITAVSDSSLAEAINTVNSIKGSDSYKPEDGIFAIHLSSDIALRMPLPKITSDIAIEGNGFEINGGNRNRIFHIDRGELMLNHITLVNGKDSKGGAIFNDNGTLTVTNMYFSQQLG